MKRRPSRTSNGDSVLAEGATPCIWMTAGLITYRLCDRHLDCENCPLDQAMSGGETGPARTRQVERSDEGMEFPVDRRYHASHTWAMAVDETTVRFGIDAFVARVLPRVQAAVLPATGSGLQAGNVGCWLMDNGEPIPISVPVSGRLLERNPQVLREPGLVTVSPYDDGWLAELRCPEAPRLVDALFSARQARRRAGASMRRMHQGRGASRGREDRLLGATMQDGGQPLGDLRRVLGPDRYRRLVISVLK